MVDPFDILRGVKDSMDKTQMSASTANALNFIRGMASLCLQYKKTPAEMVKLYNECLSESKKLKLGKGGE